MKTYKKTLFFFYWKNIFQFSTYEKKQIDKFIENDIFSTAQEKEKNYLIVTKY